jgi:hypothetical protein
VTSMPNISLLPVIAPMNFRAQIGTFALSYRLLPDVAFQRCT